MTRIEREKETVGKMIRVYCKGNHKGSLKEMCKDCSDLLEYAHKKLERCVFGNNKGSCRKCKIHCYEPVYKERIKGVMRYSGPRMTYKYPLLAIVHLWNEFVR